MYSVWGKKKPAVDEPYEITSRRPPRNLKEKKKQKPMASREIK